LTWTRTYIQDFTLQDRERSRLVTVRMLLDHTSRLPGTWMLDLPKSPHMRRRRPAEVRLGRIYRRGTGGPG
jgi:CubicO group peptidase (beta-lactamase class C family)